MKLQECPQTQLLRYVIRFAILSFKIILSTNAVIIKIYWVQFPVCFNE